MAKFPPDIERELDKTVGKDYHELASLGPGRRLLGSIPKWIAGVALAIAVVAVILLVVKERTSAPRPAAIKPVVIEIVPAK